ncbi:hypothetical protein CC85DRAFT_21675 [Cutaneotrichosporon oleaginosum]|uniref:Uncharacterized protein n=1 Tax=Cutaneotrichosporon oleaginosum TaxID=879819 RepID=A0A0J0XC22_9TREE|nr:uncharacterized protein CC85DRAFT_21675 [Cutaneotrichosporon oleaginosum]KLT38602.1 hypothetical protein CC85DRAFT_21675 [Cutaneotrichosporon oleaginosum]TXT05802.1 hypothetical protein COLE_07122 [Cutaneotrichosporon oleaginosum]
MGILKENFDENDLMRFANLSDIQPFLLAAASRIWQKYVDSGCPPPTLRAQGYDAWAGWVDAHVPALESLPPRPFTKVNHDDPDAEPTIVWLDHELKQVPAPKLRPGRLANALKRGTAPPHAPSTTLSPPSSVPSASVASASGFSGSPPSSAPVPLLHPPSPRSAPSSRPSPMATMRHFFSRTRRPRVPSMPPNP